MIGIENYFQRGTPLMICIHIIKTNTKCNIEKALV